jgi:glycosyltransferase involved in cell wall biosynthesis
MLSACPLFTRPLEEIFDSTHENAFGAVSFDAYGRWCFSPRLYAAAINVAERADFVTLHSLFSYPVLVGYLLAKRFHKPYGLWPHGVFAPVQTGVSRRKKSLYMALRARRILDSASVLFYSASGERDEARELGLKAPSVVIPHGIDIRPFANLPPKGSFRKKYLSGHSGPIVLYLGRLNLKKGIDLLIAAMTQVVRTVPDVRLVIAGGAHPPSFNSEVKGWLAAAGLSDSAVITGLLGENEKLSAFADCDVFVMPSIAENFGFAMFEAMASGRPVICAETLNYASEVKKHEAGIAVRRSADELAAAIALLLSDPVRSRILGTNGQRLARAYSWEACGEKLEMAVRCILNKEPFPAALQPE